MKFIKKPAFLTGMLAAILLFIGVGLRSSGNTTAEYIIYTGVALAGVFWIWSVISVINAPDMKPFQKRFWLISVVAVPVVGALIFHIMHQEGGKITT